MAIAINLCARCCAEAHAFMLTRQGGSSANEADDFSFAQFGPDQHCTIGGDGVSLKHIVRQLQSDGDNILLLGTTPTRGSTMTKWSHSSAWCEGRPLQHIGILLRKRESLPLL